MNIEDRKAEHIQICLEDAVESGAAGGLERYRLRYQALPELSLDEVDLTTTLAGKTLRAPVVIGAMTGGTKEAGAINRTLAAAAQRCGVGLALGSARIVLEHPSTAASFSVRDEAPDALIFANLGAVQLNYGVTGADARHLCEALDADALNFHLNPLQEAIQPGGDTNFAGLFDKLRDAIPEVGRPVFVKEVGAGISAECAALLASLPLDGVETAGVGGTSWARVEALRADDVRAHAAGIALGGFGVPTAQSIVHCRAAMPERVVIGSGGIRTALHMATAIALGADAAAAALPFLKAAQGGVDAVCELIDHFVHTLRIICFVCGARTPRDLRDRLDRIDAPA